MEIFRWLLRNGINKIESDVIKTKILIQHYLRLDGPKGPVICPPSIKGLQISLFYLSQFGEI